MRYKFAYIDTSAYIIISTYLIQKGMCLFVGEELYSIEDIITPIASTIIFSVLLYFVLEMSYMRAALEEESALDYQYRLKSIRKVKYFMFIMLLGVYFPANMIQFFQMYYDHIDISVVIARTVSMCIVDMYMFPLFIIHLHFFCSVKISQTFTFKNKLILLAILLNWLFKFIHALAMVFVVALRRFSLLYEKEPSQFIAALYLISVRTYGYIVDFLNMMALVYLFKC